MPRQGGTVGACFFLFWPGELIMFFRFGAAIVLIVLICLIGIAIEKRNLDLRRELSHQHEVSEELLETHARLRLKTQQLGATSRLMDEFSEPAAEESGAEHIRLENASRLPLLRWRTFSPVGSRSLSPPSPLEPQ